MICPTCNHETSHIKILPSGREVCHNCGGFSESGGVKTDKILTRNADRVREQQLQHEGDMITPYVWDEATKKVVLNQDFVELYPVQAADTFTEQELRAAGHGKLIDELKHGEWTEQSDDPDVEFKGDEREAIKEIVNGEAAQAS